MKKAKLMLAAIAVIAVAGGVYASKASRLTSIIYTRATNTTVCSVTLAGFSTTTVVPGQLPVGTTFLTFTPGICPNTFEYYTAP
jgi:hypothetical protein